MDTFFSRQSRSLAAAAALTVLVGCGRPAPATNEESGPIGVTVQPARTATLRDVTTASGIVVPSAAGDWTVFAPGAAEIVELPKKETETVAIGDVLVRFAISTVAQELAARELGVGEARQRVDRAKETATRLSGLFDRGLAARNAVEAARQDQMAAESQLSQAVLDLSAAKAAEDRGTIRARFPGVVAKVFHGIGDLVGVGIDDPVIRVIDLSRLQVAVQIPLAQLARIVPGQVATVRAIAGDLSELATVTSKPPTSDPNLPTAEVRIAFTSPTALPIDTPVSVEILFDQRTDALVVPNAAVRTDQTGTYVMVAGDDSRAHRREVRRGLVTETLTQIMSGIATGDRVIVGGAEDIVEGAPLAIR